MEEALSLPRVLLILPCPGAPRAPFADGDEGRWVLVIPWFPRLCRSAIQLGLLRLLGMTTDDAALCQPARLWSSPGVVATIPDGGMRDTHVSIFVVVRPTLALCAFAVGCQR